LKKQWLEWWFGLKLKKFMIIPGMLFLAVLLSAPSPAQEDGGARSLSQAAEELGLGNFSTALESAGLAGILDNQGVLLMGEGSFVVFAPSDEALAAASAFGYDLESLQESPSELKALLYRHIIWNAGGFENISEISEARSMQGENITLEHVPAMKVDGANVTASLQYDSGTIYVIDRLLLPESEGSLGAAQAAMDLGAEKFAESLTSSGLEETLSGQGLMGIGGLTSGPYTVFAPSDAAFEAAKEAVDGIGEKEGGMLSLLSYHVVDAAELVNMTESNSVKTMYGASLPVDINASLVGGASVLASQRYDNGMVYVIDQVLLPIGLGM
jgi:uncharacterized surface protein with fasciclin (FAS1) repeats